MEPELGGAAEPLPAGGALWEPEPLAMLGQLWVEPDPELELEPELDPEPEAVLPEPVLEVLVFDDGVVVEELDVEPEPVFPELDVVAALAASAPPAKRPDESAPTARTLRRRICMTCSFRVWCVVLSGPFGPAPHTLRLPPVASRRASAARWWSSLTIR